MHLFPGGKIYSTELCKNINVHLALYRESRDSGMSTQQYAEENGFIWKNIEPVMDFSGDLIQEDADVFFFINRIYASQPLLGNAILTKQQKSALYDYAKGAFDKQFIDCKPLTSIEQKALVLETIYALQTRDSEDTDDEGLQAKMWCYIFKHFCGYTLESNSAEYQRYYHYFCKAIEATMISTKHLLVPSEANGVHYQRYYNTLLIHALAPVDTINRFISLLFDFYAASLDYQYIPDDPAFKLLVNAIKAQWNDRFDSEVAVRSINATASLKTLLELCPLYSRKFCEYTIQKFDGIISGYGVHNQFEPTRSRIDALIDQWFQQRSLLQRKEAQSSRSHHRNDRVAIHKSDIHASYELIENNAYIVLPKIRFEETICAFIAGGNRPKVVISIDGKELHTDDMKIFGEQIYTSREYHFLLEQAAGSSFHFSVKILIGEDNQEIYNSERTLYREFILLSCSSGREIRNIQKMDSDTAYLFVPTESNVDFEDDADNIYEVNCSFAQKFALNINDLHVLTINGTELYADETAKNHTRIRITPEKVRSASILCAEDTYPVHSEVENICIELAEEADEKQYQVQLDDTVLPLPVFSNCKAQYLPSMANPGPHKIKVIDLLDGRTVCFYHYFIIPQFTCTFDNPVYWNEGKVISVQTFDAVDGVRSFTFYVDPGSAFLQISDFREGATLCLDIPVVQASLRQNDMHTNLFALETKDVWVDDLKSDTFLRVDCPKGWVHRVFLGTDELVCSRNMYEVGNFLQAYRAKSGQQPLVLRLEKQNAQSMIYMLLSIHFTPFFRQCPVIYEKGTLYWEVEGNFIGSKSQDFRLYLYDTEKELYRYSLIYKNEKVEKNLSLDDGIYRFVVTGIKSNVFHEEETELYTGQLVVGNPYDFKYRNAVLILKSASCWDQENGGYIILGLRESNTRIIGLTYIDTSDVPFEEVGECPHYRGILQFWNSRRESWTPFCSDSEKKEFELINPVDIWLINEHFLSMYSVTKDAVYIDSNHKGILGKAEHTLIGFEKAALQLPDKFQYELKQGK